MEESRASIAELPRSWQSPDIPGLELLDGAFRDHVFPRHSHEGLMLSVMPSTHDAPAWARLQGPNQWPAALPDLRPVVLQWQAAATRVSMRLLRALSVALGQSESVLEPMYRDDPHVLVKLIRYPGRDATAGDQGVGAHEDSGLLSLLLRDDQRGLQVETAHGWVDVTPRAPVKNSKNVKPNCSTSRPGQPHIAWP
jgi:isopenicillin N synthase-like dioxygenase